MSRTTAALAGMGLGAAWGVAARVWMRLVSESPEFSWAGTLFIVGGFAVAGLLLGLAYGVVGAGGSSWWRLLVLPTLVLFAGAGAPLLPAYLVGGWGIRRRGAAGVVGVLGLVTSPILVLVLAAETLRTTVYPQPDSVVLLLAGFGSTVLSVLLAYGGSAALGPRPSRSPSSSQVHQVAPAGAAV